MRVCHFEDQHVGGLEPLVLTRPAFELLCGQDSLRAKQCRTFHSSARTPATSSQEGEEGKAKPDVGVLIRPYLAPLYRLHQPQFAVNDLAWLRAEATILVNARWLPALLPSAPPFAHEGMPEGPYVAMIGDEIAYAVVTAEPLSRCSPDNLSDCLETWKHDLPRRPAGGCLIRYLWELIERNAEQLILDFQFTAVGKPSRRTEALPALVGPTNQLLIDRTARLDPLIVADTTRGPVVIDREAVITAFSRLEGPCYIGPHTHVLGAKIRAGTTLGPHCRVGGEVEASIVHGSSNKYHDGFLGHSYVGEWVNFGAGTQSSDLRNDYGEVMVPLGGRPVATGRSKVGCFLGDHTKTGLGALINTGTTAGVFCNLLPCGRLLPRYFPSFSSCWKGTLAVNDNLSRLLETARVVMQRRGATLTETHRALFHHLFDQSATEREHLLRREGQWPLRNSA